MGAVTNTKANAEIAGLTASHRSAQVPYILVIKYPASTALQLNHIRKMARGLSLFDIVKNSCGNNNSILTVTVTGMVWRRQPEFSNVLYKGTMEKHTNC